MPVYFGLRYEQKMELAWSEPFTCVHCGHRTKAGVTTIGTGSGRAPYAIGRDAAKERAGTEAFQSAVDAARELILLARCPSCGQRQGGLTAVAVKFLVGCAIVAGCIQFTASRLGGSRPGELLEWPVGALVLLYGGAVALAALLIRRRVQMADRGVRFEPVIVVPEPAAAPTEEPAQPVVSNDWQSWHAANDAAEGPAPDSDGSELELDLDRSWKSGKK